MKVIDDDVYISAISMNYIQYTLLLSRESVIIHLKIFMLLKLWHFWDGDDNDYWGDTLTAWDVKNWNCDFGIRREIERKVREIILEGYLDEFKNKFYAAYLFWTSLDICS